MVISLGRPAGSVSVGKVSVGSVSVGIVSESDGTSVSVSISVISVVAVFFVFFFFFFVVSSDLEQAASPKSIETERISASTFFMFISPCFPYPLEKHLPDRQVLFTQ